jgi:tRNA uridine 5-carbamoylmethylation protein Kti12
VKVLLIVRGLPGSGKSTLAQRIVELLPNFVHIEADTYHITDGKYAFDQSKVYEAHDWCWSECVRQLNEGNNVVVSNTFTTLDELDRYFDLRNEIDDLGIGVICCILTNKSTHNVPQDKIDKMEARWEVYTREVYYNGGDIISSIKSCEVS